MVKKGITPQIARKIRAEKGLRETKLYKMRIKKGLSQSALADKSGVSVRTIRSFEQDENSIDKAQLQTLCKLSLSLDCKMQDILEDEEVIKMLDDTK